jgi:hypothetical protein
MGRRSRDRPLFILVRDRQLAYSAKWDQAMCARRGTAPGVVVCTSLSLSARGWRSARRSVASHARAEELDGTLA